MRIRLSILSLGLLIVSSLGLYGQKPVVSELSQVWEAGKYSRVTIKLNFTSTNGFARFTQDMPEGIDIVPDIVPEGDFSYNGRQVNVVWLTIPEGAGTSFSYLARPGSEMNGTFSLGGRLIHITGGSSRQEYYMDSSTVSITGAPGTGNTDKPASLTISGRPVIRESGGRNDLAAEEKSFPGVEFRIQVATSSKPLTPGQVDANLGISPRGTIRTVKDGSIYKYQSGSFASYSEASAELKRIRAAGAADAFIVAWSGGKQVPVDDKLRRQQP